MEYFLGGNTNTTGFTALPGVTNTAATLSVTWTKAASYTGTYGTDFVVETSATLKNDWVTEASGVNVHSPLRQGEILSPRHHQLSRSRSLALRRTGNLPTCINLEEQHERNQ